MEGKPKKWQRRGVFALVSQREGADALGRYTAMPNAPEEDGPPEEADEE